MTKRFTDTEKWRKGFVRSLDAPYKLLWLYILDECDHAGIWHVELDVACLRIGFDVDMQSAIDTLGKHIYPFDENEKWFIVDFISFQYGELNEANRVHQSVIRQLRKYGLWKVYISSLEGAKDKDKDKDKDKKKVKDTYSDSVERIWNCTPRMGKQRSSKKDLQTSWNSVNPKPQINIVLESLEKYSKSPEWEKDNGQYVPGIHRWVKSRKWEVDIDHEPDTKSPEDRQRALEIEAAMLANPIR